MLTLERLMVVAAKEGIQLWGWQDIGRRPVTGFQPLVDWQDPLTAKGQGVLLLGLGNGTLEELISLCKRAGTRNYTGLVLENQVLVANPALKQGEGIEDLPLLILPPTMTLSNFRDWVYGCFPSLLRDPLLAPKRLVTSGFWLDEALSY